MTGLKGHLTAVTMAFSLATGMLSGFPSVGSAQVRDTLKADSAVARARQQILLQSHSIKLHEVAFVGGVMGLAFLLDEPVQRYLQRHRSHTTNDIAGVFRKEGEPVYYAGISLGILGTGIILRNPDLRRAGGRVVASALVSALVSEGVKRLVGRSRPNEDAGAFNFHPFTTLQDSAGVETRGSMPSGHTTAAFAVAASLADDIHSTTADILLYTLAAGTAYSRMNDNRHWLSDTWMGAALGITTAKLVNGRWRIFGLRPPKFLITPTGAPAVSFDF
jgi:membrane-associated phospholipid phosphatase